MKLNFFFIFLFLSKDRQELKKKKKPLAVQVTILEFKSWSKMSYLTSMNHNYSVYYPISS